MNKGGDDTIPQKVLKSQMAYNRIREDIVREKLKPGEPLFERQLCACYGVSRTPIRDALKRLAIENFVEITPSYCAFVTRITSGLILETYSIREVLEGLACRLYAKRISTGEKRELQILCDTFIDLMKHEKYEDSIKSDISFHEKIISECGSPTLISMLSPITEQINRITHSTHYDKIWASETIRLHKAICDAIIGGDSMVAEAAMREHIAISRNHHLELLR